MDTETQDSQAIDFNAKFAEAFDLLENSGRNVFVTGKAGTGKSTLLQYFRDHTTKNMAILAPTGVAAVNVRGQTIHSFFRFRPDTTPESVAKIRLRKGQRQIYKNLEVLVIDEISMVRADLLDCIDQFLRLYGPNRKQAFGGVQMVFFGDLYQLPPVVTQQERSIFQTVYPSPYFFDANAFASLNIKIVELEFIYRQREENFIRLLGVIRDKRISNADIEELNQRFRPDFTPSEGQLYIYLTTTNALAERINQERLRALRTRPCVFDGDLMGEFDKRSLPTSMELEMKYGAQVMLLNNDPQGRWFNGSIGKVIEADRKSEKLIVELNQGDVVELEPFTWDMYRFTFDEELEQVVSESVGAFRQFPVKLAWAVTIHKSQGQTFQQVVLDSGTGMFAHGQAYVALSRCTTFEGLVLKRAIRRSDILVDDRVIDFLRNFREI